MMLSRFITHLTNLNDPASDHTPVLLHIGAQPLLKQNRPTITPGIKLEHIQKYTFKKNLT